MTRILQLVVLTMVGPVTGVWAQDRSLEATSSGAPRFLLAASPTPVLLDVRRTPLLRRQLTLDLKGATIHEALTTIATQAGLQLTYTEEVVPKDTRVSLQANAITVAAALTEVLLDAGLDVVFSASNRAVLVKRAQGTVPPQTGSLTGRVTDAKSGQPIVGGEVLLEGIRRRASSDTAGWYRFTDVPVATYTLIVRRFGYAKQSRQVTVRDGKTDTLHVAIEPVVTRLDELVSTATGRQRRRDIGNAVTTINADSVMRTAPIRSLTDLLENRVPGLTVQHTTGAPGDPSRLRLGGIGSVLRSNDPVVVVDGARVYAAQSGDRSGNLTNRIGGTVGRVANALPAPSPLDQIDPNIIETIEVLNGPSAATLYGADAANGVIVITTKKGRPGPAQWSATADHGRTDTPGKFPEGYFPWGHSIFDDSKQLCQVNNLGCVTDSLIRYQLLNDPAMTMLGQGQRTAASVSVGGGSSALTYSITGTYADETGLLKLPAYEEDRYRRLVGRNAPDWMRRPHQFTTWSATSSLRAVLGPKAEVGLLTILSRSEQQRSSLENQLANVQSFYVDKISGVYYDPRVKTGYGVQPGPTPPTNRDAQGILQSYYQRTTASSLNFTTSVNAAWRPWSWLSSSAQASINVIPRHDQQLLPVGPEGYGSQTGTVLEGSGRSLVSTFNAQGTARRPLGRGLVFETSAGFNVSNQRTDDLVSSGEGLRPGTSSVNGAQRVTVTDDQSSASVFGWYIEPRVAGQRLALSTGLRLDGGSAYGARLTRSGGGLFGLLSLPKLNGSWTISEEPWFPFRAAFNSLRLRGAYGQAQVQPGATDRLRLFSPSAVNGNYVLTTLGNTQLRPERSSQFEGGFDADLLDNRLSLEVTGRRKTQLDALMNVTLPGSVNGGGSVTVNIGTIRNTGFDLRANVTPLRSPAVRWTMEAIYSTNTNLLVKLGTGAKPSPEQGLVEGYPVGGRFDRPILGFADQNGNGLLEANEIVIGDSMVYLGRLLPKSKTALSTTLVLARAVTINANFSYDAGAAQISEVSQGNWVLFRALADPSTPLSEQAAVVASTIAVLGPTDRITTYGVTSEVSTFRFSSLSLRYQAPANIARALRAQSLSIAVQGSNLGLHSNYMGKDPNVTAWSAGENVVDTGQLPLPRTWQLSFSVQY